MMKPDEPVLLRTLKQHGYFVWWGGKNDLVPPQHGYDDYCDIKYEPPPHKHFPNCDPDWRGPPNGDNYYSFYIGRLAGRASEPRHLDSDWDHVLGAIDLICSCVPDDLFPKWAPESSAIGGIFTLLPMLFANWYLWTRWRSYRLAKKSPLNTRRNTIPGTPKQAPTEPQGR